MIAWCRRCHAGLARSDSLAGLGLSEGQVRPAHEAVKSEPYLHADPLVRGPCRAGGMQDWPAVTAWQDWGYLKAKCGRRTVPVEVGRHYTAEQWGQRLMLFSDFLDSLEQPPRVPGWSASSAWHSAAESLRMGLVEVECHYTAEQWGQRLMLFSDFLDSLEQPAGVYKVLGVTAGNTCPTLPAADSDSCRSPEMWCSKSGLKQDDLQLLCYLRWTAWKGDGQAYRRRSGVLLLAMQLKHELPAGGEMAYLAQHSLFEQIPELAACMRSHLLLVAMQLKHKLPAGGEMAYLAQHSLFEQVPELAACMRSHLLLVAMQLKHELPAGGEMA